MPPTRAVTPCNEHLGPKTDIIPPGKTLPALSFFRPLEWLYYFYCEFLFGLV
ncbi:mCG147941 [Mus musculus]|nr:mCG147941 [Mus musculus]